MLKNPKYIYGPSDRLVPANINFGDFILRKINENNDKIALINGSTQEEQTYRELQQEAINLAISLTHLGVKKGDVIAISSENRREFWSTLIGISCTGATTTTINVAYTNVYVMEQENEYADVSVVTLRDLAKRRAELVRKKQLILDKLNNTNLHIPQTLIEPSPATQLPCFSNASTSENVHDSIAYCETLTTVFEPSPGPSASSMMISNIPEALDFSSDNVDNDPDYVPLSEITNLQPIATLSESISNANVEWYVEREIEPEVAKESRTRKRKADRSSWAVSINKNNRMLGKEYIGLNKIDNLIQKQKRPKRAIGTKCNSAFCNKSKVMFCSQLTEDLQKPIFEDFWSKSWQEKKIFVISMIDKVPVRRGKKGHNSRRSNTKFYYLQVNGRKERVCLKTFLATLGIKEWTVRYWLGEGRGDSRSNTELTTNLNTTATQDYSTSKKSSVKDYLTLLPKLPSHYCRKTTTKQYLEPLFQSKSQLYNTYVEFASSMSKPVASRKLFCDILDEQNIALFQPKKDAWDYCCSYKAGNVSEEDYQYHIQLKELARAEKLTDKESAQRGLLHAVTADLQAVKLCPSLAASALYFKTKLAVHNFTLYDIATGHVTCYWFDETACDLRATTYASFFIDYLTKLLEKDCRDVVIWTDGCTAQNRNSIVSNALLRLAIDKNTTITQKYLEKGHTQMEVDSVHSVVERKLKNVEIFLPSQYASITKEARKHPSPYQVFQPDYTFFKDYSLKEYQIYDSIRPGCSAGDDCVVDLRVLKYNPNGTIEFKKHFKDDFSPLPRRPKPISAVVNYVPSLYSSRLPILDNELKHVMSISKPKYIFCSPFAYKAHMKVYKSVSHLKMIFLFGNESHPNTILYKDLAIVSNDNRTDKVDRYKITRNVTFEEFEVVDVEGQNDVVLILYSSGTTGLPKGVMLTHLNVIALCSPSIVLPSSKPLHITPWYHAMGLISGLANFCKGVTTVYLPKFEVELYLKTIERYKISQLSVVPAMLIALCKSNFQYDTSSVELIFCGAAPLYEETAQAVKQRFPSAYAVLQGYGMTETTLAISINFNPDKIGSVGTVISHTVAKVVNPETSEVLGPHEKGEICVKSIMGMKGYVGKNRRDDFDDEGFLKTGDIGYYDEEGYLYIVDRLKELIKYKAYQVPPAEIEAVLLKNPDIREAGVIGIPHSTAGEVPLAFVVLQPGKTLTEKEVQEFVAERLSNPKHLRGGVRFINEIPKNQTGKLLRKELRNLAKSSKSKL